MECILMHHVHIFFAIKSLLRNEHAVTSIFSTKCSPVSAKCENFLFLKSWSPSWIARFVVCGLALAVLDGDREFESLSQDQEMPLENSWRSSWEDLSVVSSRSVWWIHFRDYQTRNRTLRLKFLVKESASSWGKATNVWKHNHCWASEGNEMRLLGYRDF